MIDHETTRRQDDMSGEHRLLACCFRQLAESWDRRATVEAALSAATPRPSQATRPFGYRSGQFCHSKLLACATLWRPTRAGRRRRTT